MTFRCKVGKNEIKAFAQAINSCCKLGEDIYLDGGRNELTIKVLNEPYKSAFMMISFESDFFELYEIEGRFVSSEETTMNDHSRGNRTSQSPKMRCKLKTRSCLLAFKKEKTLVKNLEYCEINIKASRDFAQFKFVYASKCVKTMDLPLGNDALDVNDDIFQNGQHKVTCKSKILTDVLTYFAKEDEYITMKANPQSIEFETHFADRDKSGKLTKTNIDIDEFELYNVTDDIFLTYSLRLIKPFLSYCSGRIPEIDIFMDGSNQPICFNAEYPPHIKVSLALATLDVNHPTTARNSSRSSVMYQTNPSSQQGETNRTRISRLSSQSNSETPSNSQNSIRSNQSRQQSRAQETINNRLISNEEQHESNSLLTQDGDNRNNSVHSIAPKSLNVNTEDDNREEGNIENEILTDAIVDEILDDEIMRDEILDDEIVRDENMDDQDGDVFPTQSTIGPSCEEFDSQSQQPNLDQLSKRANSQLSYSISQLPSSLTNGTQSSDKNNQNNDSYWMSLEIRPESQLSESSNELLVPPTDDEMDDSDED